jgi:hypothetical protein
MHILREHSTERIGHHTMAAIRISLSHNYWSVSVLLDGGHGVSNPLL